MDDKECQSEVQHERELREQWQTAHALFHKLDKESLILAKAEVDRRLEEMNQFRAQIADERGQFVSREFYDAQHRRLEEAVDVKLGAIDGRLKILETNKSNFEGRMWAMGAGITAIAVGLNLVFHFIGK